MSGRRYGDDGLHTLAVSVEGQPEHVNYRGVAVIHAPYPEVIRVRDALVERRLVPATNANVSVEEQDLPWCICADCMRVAKVLLGSIRWDA